MKNLNELDTLEIDFSAIYPIENISENIMLSEELLEKYKIEIDESKIEQIIAEIPEEPEKHYPLRIKSNTSEKFLLLMFLSQLKTYLTMFYVSLVSYNELKRGL